VKKYIFDMLVHGSVAIFKEKLGNKVENFYTLPGGMVIPLKSSFVGGYQAYVQMIYGCEPLIYFNDEISYGTYMPTTARAYGMVPLEALINKISETLLFDKLMAEQADGTRPPEKMVIITEQSPFGDMDKEYGVPLDPDEQARIEQKINTPKKNSVITFSGNGATVVDLSRENTMALQTQRQKDIREEVALVFNASNMEMGLTGSEGTSGRSTSEAQQEITQQRGIKPLVQKLETQLNKDIIPMRFGMGFVFKFEADKNEREKAEIMQIKMASGLYSVNEIRKDDLNLDPFDGEEFEKPSGSSAQKPPDGSIANPLNMKGLPM
jgi:hypothetical protein